MPLPHDYPAGSESAASHASLSPISSPESGQSDASDDLENPLDYFQSVSGRLETKSRGVWHDGERNHRIDRPSIPKWPLVLEFVFGRVTCVWYWVDVDVAESERGSQAQIGKLDVELLRACIPNQPLENTSPFTSEFLFVYLIGHNRIQNVTDKRPSDFATIEHFRVVVSDRLSELC